MEIKIEPEFEEIHIKTDSMDIPDCFGEYDKESRLCFKHCALCIKCCVMQTRHPKVDILEKILIHNEYSAKPN